MRRRGHGVLRRAGVLAVVTAGLLGACSGAVDAAPTASTSAATLTPSPTPTPTPTPMALPTPAAEFGQPTPDGAIAAGQHFVALYDYAFSSGDVEPFMAMSGEGCEYCAHVQSQVQMMLDGGYTSIREPIRVQASNSAEIREDEWFRVHLRVEQGPLVTVAPDGRREQTSDGGTVDFIFAMAWQDATWRVMAVDLEEVTT